MAQQQENQIGKALSDLLQQLQAHPYPDIPSPEGCNRRASVALILRVKPSYSHWPPADASTIDDLAPFFAQDWAQHGDPEALFIKRASRKGDRWTSHIALPGGRRDAEDADDYAAAVRETWEEVGLDLNAHAVPCGNLPQRIVTTHWGKKPLLVLCPYIFLLTSHDHPPLRLQPTEVASTHWVPIRHLQSPKRRTVVYEDVSARVANEETGVKRWMLRLVLGKMMFSAISLLPSESLHSDEPAVEQTLQDNRHIVRTRYGGLKELAARIWHADLFHQDQPLPADGPLLLWGLTLGVMSDFLDLLPPHNALTVWTYPTFTPLDVRFTIWLMTYRFRYRKRVELQAGHNPPFGFISPNVPPPGSLSIEDDPSASTVFVPRPDETGFHGLGTGLVVGPAAASSSAITSRKAAVATMLEGCVESCASLCLPDITDRARYYDVVRHAVTVALVGRAGAGIVIGVLLWRRFSRA